MAGAYLYAEDQQAAQELVGMAERLGLESALFAIGDAGDLAFAGADRLMVLAGGSVRPEDYAEAMADIVLTEDGALFAAVSTARSREIAARVAASLDAGMISDATMLSADAEGVHATRSMYGGAVVTRVTVPGKAVATIVPGVFAPAERQATANVEERAIDVDARVARVSLEPMAKGEVDLTKAGKVVGVGLGLEKQEDLPLIDKLAGVLGAGVGCTRDFAEGRGWLPKERYIGITGVQVKPDLYLAVGVSGAMQHMFGVRDAKVVVAVNKEKSAPVFRSCDYGVVGDLYDVVPRLIEALR